MFFSNKYNNLQKNCVRQINNNVRYLSLLNLDKFLIKFNTSLHGLNTNNVDELSEIYGKNTIELKNNITNLSMFWNSFKSPFNIILLFLMVLSFIFNERFGCIVILFMIMIGTLLRFWQDVKIRFELINLKKIVTNKVTVTRQIILDKQFISRQFEISVDDIVPGDIVHLSAGDIIPGDVRIISSKDLFISQSAITGEALPIEKREGLRKLQSNLDRYNDERLFESNLDNNFNIEQMELKNDYLNLDQPNICFMGSSVISGTAIAVVFSIGWMTLFGTITSQLHNNKIISFLDKEMKSVSILLMKFIFLMAPIIFLINGFIKGDWITAFLFSVSIVVGLTPEMLPVILSMNLAKGAVKMSKKKVIIKNLNTIYDFGAIDVLCTDKTGTLTKDRVILLKHLDAGGIKSINVLKQAFLNSYFQTGLRNLLDKAVIDSAANNFINDIHTKYKLIDEIPFDFVRKRMSVILENLNDHSRIFLCKGATDEILKNCLYVNYNNKIVLLTDKIKNQLIIFRDLLYNDGLRVVAIAYKELKEWSVDNFFVEDEKKLIFSGYIAFLDPPKETAAEALLLLKKYGIDIKILTGDGIIVAKKICQEVGLSVENILTGVEMSTMSEEELTKRIKNITIFARLSPFDKFRIVKNLKKQDKVVGFLGDGINDALALKESDVGISVDSGTDLAKESADIILLEKSLLILYDAVIEGRKIFSKVSKYIKISCSSNFGNVLSILIASITLPFLPIIPIQLLIQNLLYDISQITMPWDKMDNNSLKNPIKKNRSNSIVNFMLYIGPISSFFDILTFIILWYILHFNNFNNQSSFQTGWFIEGLLTQILVVHMIRTSKIPFLQSMSTLPVVIMSLFIIIVGILLPFIPFMNELNFVVMPIRYFLWLFLIIISYCVTIQICKMFYIKKFNTWI